MARNPSRRNGSAAQEEWEPYACLIPARGDHGFDRRTCSTLDQVFHVAHVPDACRIIEDGRIKAGLIGDESRLRVTRTSVCWLSANYWTPGSIYGTIQFTFKWEQIIRDRDIYWVEVMNYPNPAYRLLITDRDFPDMSLLRPYDPETAQGPLRLRNGDWYWNDEFTSEFMLDADLSLRHCVDIKAISHRADRCRLYSPNCTEANGTVWENGARTLAYVLARDLTRVRHCFVQLTEEGDQQLGSTVRDAIKFLLDELTPEEPHGPISSERRSDAVLVGALLLYGSGQIEDAQEAVRVLASQDTARAALERQARRYFRLPAFSLPIH
jgi:hypothetical protein